MKTKHTPGPWLSYDMGNGIRITPASVSEDLLPHVSAVRNEIALLKPNAGNDGWSDEMWSIQKANAHLIAAAPSLLELALYISGCLTETGECVIKLGQPMDEVVTKLIAKATGGAE